jgi:hypothetical protein
MTADVCPGSLATHEHTESGLDCVVDEHGGDRGRGGENRTGRACRQAPESRTTSLAVIGIIVSQRLPGTLAQRSDRTSSRRSAHTRASPTEDRRHRRADDEQRVEDRDPRVLEVVWTVTIPRSSIRRRLAMRARSPRRRPTAERFGPQRPRSARIAPVLVCVSAGSPSAGLSIAAHATADATATAIASAAISLILREPATRLHNPDAQVLRRQRHAASASGRLTPTIAIACKHSPDHRDRNRRGGVVSSSPASLLLRAYWSSFAGRRMPGERLFWACPCRGPLLDQRLPAFR